MVTSASPLGCLLVRVPADTGNHHNNNNNFWTTGSPAPAKSAPPYIITAQYGKMARPLAQVGNEQAQLPRPGRTRSNYGIQGHLPTTTLGIGAKATCPGWESA